MRIVIVALLCFAFAHPVLAQGFEPLPLRAPSNAASAAVAQPEMTLQGGYFQFARAGLSDLKFAQVSPIFAVDAPVTDKIFAGGWFASDRQKQASSHLESTWYELHATDLPVMNPSVNFGVMLGVLSVRLEDASLVNRGNWTEVGLVTSVPLSRSGRTHRGPVAGLSIATDRHQDSGENNAYSVAGSLAWPVSSIWSLNMSVTRLAIDNASTITIAAAGVGYSL
ncbi:MAG: hypothetical protein P4L33_20875 [Capsulimonadaceae bacterium]|nr:hypothetical protein [Capsulimonadaceae bacterium]